MSFLHTVGRFVKSRLAPGSGAKDQWPFVSGDFKVVNATAPVVVTTSASESLAADLAALAPRGLCMVCALRGGPGELAKLVRTVAANLSIQHLICAGEEHAKRPLGAACLSLGAEDDEESADAVAELVDAARAKLDNGDLAAFRKQVKSIDMLGCTDIDKIISRINELSSEAKRPNTGFVAPQDENGDGVERLIAARNVSYEARPDKAGDFDIRLDGDRIVVEHYDSKERLTRVIEGSNARDIYLTLIGNGWVSKLDHAAYLGRELTRAESALRRGEPFMQDEETLANGD